MAKVIDCDILIIGAGMTGNCLARQLHLAHPDLHIMNIDKKTDFDYWVGESTVEAWEDYMTRVLRLGPMLEKNFFQKHGLRFFCDSREKNLSISEMSEAGRTHYHHIPARNLDRALFDKLMCEINKESGIDVRLGVAVERDKDSVQLGEGGEKHIVKTSIGDIRCRYLVDASGRSSQLAKQKQLVKTEKRNRSASYWARYKNCNWIDDMGDDEWRSRVNYTTRYNSTNHFLYRGYWMWLIPVTDNMVSIGVEFNREKTKIKIRNGKDFDEFLKSHKCMKELIGDRGEAVDFFAMADLPRCADQHFSKDGWFLAGMSGLFVDVMGSGTSRLYAEVNRMIGELISTDLKGDEELLESQLRHFNLAVKASFELHFRNLTHYDWYGSFDVWPNFFGAGLSKYFNSQLPNNISDLSELKKTAEEHKGGCACSFEKFQQDNMQKGLATAYNRITEEFVQFLDAHDVYYARNKGQFLDLKKWENRKEIVDKIYQPRCLETEEKVDRETYQILFETYTIRMCETLGVEYSRSVFERIFDPNYDNGQTLSEVVDGLKHNKAAA